MNTTFLTESENCNKLGDDWGNWVCGWMSGRMGVSVTPLLWGWAKLGASELMALWMVQGFLNADSILRGAVSLSRPKQVAAVERS